jgi:ABC-type uncharacterized transport system auxiliary subunit
MSRAPGDLKLRNVGRAPSARTRTPRRAHRRAYIATVALMAAWLSGCVSAARPAKYYQLTVPADAGVIEREDAVPVRLLVGGLITSHLYREDRIVYGNGPEQLGTYEYQRWAEPPTEMIQEVLLRELRASGHYRAVHVRRSNMPGDFAIRGHLYDFKEVDGSAPSTRVTLELEMRDRKRCAGYRRGIGQERPA